MLPLSFKKKFDIDFANALYQHLHAHDTSVTLTLRTNSGKITNDVNKAGIGEIRNTDNKRIILMSSAEGEIILKTPATSNPRC